MANTIKGINELKELLSFESDSSEDLKDIKLRALEKTIDLFFKIDDEYGFTKTDIERHLVFPITVMFDYVDDLLPLYNVYLTKKLGSSKKAKDRLISCQDLKKVITDIYIKVLVSKSRLGRREGTQISKSLYESLKDSLQNERESIDKTISDLSK